MQADPSGQDRQPPLLQALAGGRVDPPPVWLMRQAGRYLPEYRQLRAQAGSFLDLCFDPDLAAEVTLQPVRRFGMDAAIIFADILLVPLALGQRLEFVEGEGPRLDVPDSPSDLCSLASPDFDETLAPVSDTLTKVRTTLDSDTALIGFAGAPWTVATYMVAGRGDRQPALDWLARDPAGYQQLSDLLVRSTIRYLSSQIEAGAQVLQLFDSWAGALPSESVRAVCIDPTAAIVAGLRQRHPAVPVIGFPRGLAAADCLTYAENTGVDAVALDQDLDASKMNALLPAGLPVQGNLDPAVLEEDGKGLEETVAQIIQSLRGRPHIFNLGHGIRPSARPDNVQRLVAAVRASGGTVP